MNISEMIAEGNRLLEAQKAEDDARRDEEERQIEAVKDQVYQMVAKILPSPLGDYLDRNGQFEPSYSVVTDNQFDGKYHNIYTADNYHTLSLTVPGCSPIKFNVYLDGDRGKLSNIKVGSPATDGDGNIYYSHRYAEDQGNFYIALAEAEKAYTKFGRMEAKRTARLLMQMPADELDKKDWLTLASKMSETPDEAIGAIAAALVGILEHLREAQP